VLKSPIHSNEVIDVQSGGSPGTGMKTALALSSMYFLGGKINKNQ